MENVGSFEAKTHLPQLLERVAKGEEFRPGSKSGNKPLTESGFSKMPVSSILARGSQSHDQHGENRHGLPGYVFPLSDAI